MNQLQRTAKERTIEMMEGKKARKQKEKEKKKVLWQLHLLKQKTPTRQREQLVM